MRPGTLVAVLAAALVLAACAGSEPAATPRSPASTATTPPTTSASPTAHATSAPEVAGEVAWRHLGMVEGTLADMAMAEAVTDERGLAEAWEEHGFGADAEVPSVDFGHHFVLLLAQPDDACPDELIGLDAVSGDLAVEWLEPPGPCAEPLIFRLHAIEVHRGHVPAEFTVAPPELYEGDLQPVTISLPPYDGEAPPAPVPPGQMSDAELDAVFEATGVRRCTPDDARLAEPQIVGPLSDDPEVAEAQRRRAERGVPSDVDSTRAALEDPAELPDMAPLTPAEAEAEQERSALADRAAETLDAAGVDRDRAEIVIDRFGRFGDDRGVHVVVAESAVDEIQEVLDRQLGEGRVIASSTGYDPAEQRRVQEALTPLFDSGSTEPGAITSTSGSIGPVVIGMVDPTREALEEIAATVDPSLVCVEPQLSGARR